MRADNNNRLFGFIGLLLIMIGSALMLHRLIGERLPSAGAVQMVTGFSGVAVGAVLLTKHSLAVFFYFCFVLAIAVVQIPGAGLLSFDSLVVLVLLVVGVALIRALPKKRRRRLS